jgi:hypothetical protein
LAADRFDGKTIDLASASVTGKDLERAFTAAAGRVITYMRFCEDLLAQTLSSTD